MENLAVRFDSEEWIEDKSYKDSTNSPARWIESEEKGVSPHDHLQLYLLEVKQFP